jgi:hypothetical protein
VLRSREAQAAQHKGGQLDVVYHQLRELQP